MQAGDDLSLRLYLHNAPGGTPLPNPRVIDLSSIVADGLPA
jgi:hypothetical protein